MLRKAHPSSTRFKSIEDEGEDKMKSSNLLKLIIIALLGAISFVLFFLNFPLPLLPPYLKIDFGDVPALIGSLILSPVAGIIIIAVKNILYLIIGGGDPVGVVSNFLAAVMFVLPVAIIYHRVKSVKSIVSGLVTGTLIMAIGMSILNYLVLLPVYALFMGMEEMKIEAVKRAAVIYGIFPFNLIKGIVVGIIFMPVFVKMRTWIDNKFTELA